MLKVHSTKVFPNMSCAHAQWFDTKADGSPGKCASLHGYARTVKLTFSGRVDSHGWLFPFGELKEVRSFLEYYFDHTVLLPADDPRLEEVVKAQSPLLQTLRILPYGVSMEMSSLFLWEHINPYVSSVTGGRAFLSKVECWEHEWNSAFIEVDDDTARSQYRKYRDTVDLGAKLLPKQDCWDWATPKSVLDIINGR